MAGSQNIQESLKEALQERDLTIEELVGQATELLKRVAPRQTRYKVSERPDVRTIRYYINQKLLPRPESYAGGKARYSGTHLLRLLVIKKLQAEHQTLRQIGRVLEQGDEKLAQLVVGERPLPQPQPIPPSPTPEAPPELSGATLRRVPLAGGANLDLPAAAERDPRTRRELADQLEDLARQLRGDGEET
jgi:DNA-binding transcriptional MerR regulator